MDRGEGEIAGRRGELAADFADRSIGSYPVQKDGKFGANIVIRGQDDARVEAATARLVTLFG